MFRDVEFADYFVGVTPVYVVLEYPCAILEQEFQRLAHRRVDLAIDHAGQGPVLVAGYAFEIFSRMLQARRMIEELVFYYGSTILLSL